MSKVNPDLLLEVARLLQKYPRKDWQDLLAALRDDSSMRTFEELAETMASPRLRRSIPTQIRTRTRGTRPPSVTVLLQRLRQSDPQKAEMLSQFRTLALGRQIFQSTTDLRNFAHATGLKLSNDVEREKVVSDLVRAMASMTNDEIRNRLSSLSAQSENLSEDYERWVKIILGKKE